MSYSCQILSIIIPFFNNENHLYAALSSLFDQLDDDIQVVIINDGSTDNSAKLVENFLAEHEHPHVIFVSQPNQGVATARNTGLTYASGQYIAFLDGDDVLSKDYLSIIKPVLLAGEVDLIDFNYQKFELVPPVIPACSQTIYKNYDIHLQGLKCLNDTFSHSMWHLWNRVYRRSMLDEDGFADGRRYEDVIFTPFQYFKTNHIAHLDHILYFYRDNDRGITRNIRKTDIEDMLFAMSKMIMYVGRSPANPQLRYLAALMILKCFKEVKSMSKALYGYYYYEKNTLKALKAAARCCQDTGLPRKQILAMQFPEVDTFFSKIRLSAKRG